MGAVNQARLTLKCSWHLCNKAPHGTGKFCSRKCKSKFYVDQRRKKLKSMAVEYKGGACQECGYARCVEGLAFHHLDPSMKDFKISSGQTRSWDRVRVELDKCILLCSRCHIEVHAGVRELKDVAQREGIEPT